MYPSIRKSFWILVVLLLVLVIAPQPQQPLPRAEAQTVLTVNSLADPGDGVCDFYNCTLREAINEANALPGTDFIIINLAGTITLSSHLGVLDDVTINGNGITLDGDNATRIMTSVASTVTLNDLTFQNGSGGAIYNYGTLEINNSTFSDNSAAIIGGAIVNEGGALSITDSTFSGNSADYGGAIYNYGTLEITSNTFSGNSANDGGTLYRAGGSINVASSIIADGDCSGTITDQGHNLSFNAIGCPGTVADPQLGPLQNNGGPTDTMLPALAGPAVDAYAAPCATDTDQRGIIRPQGLCDIGATEQDNTVVLAASATCNGDNLEVTITAGDGPFDVTGTAGPGLPLNGVSTGTQVLTGPGTWTDVTVTETAGDGENMNLGDFTCSVPSDTPTSTHTPTDTPSPEPLEGDLSISKTDNPDPLDLGVTNELTYTITITNLGLSDPAEEVEWTDTLPDGTIFGSLTPESDWSCSTPPSGEPGTVSCSLKEMAPSTTATFILLVEVAGDYSGPNPLVNEAYVSSLSDPVEENNFASASTTIIIPPTSTPTDTPIPPTDTPVPPSDTPTDTPTNTQTHTPTDTPSNTPTVTSTPSNTSTNTPTGPAALVVSADCNVANLEVTISAGDGPFNITASAGQNTPVFGVGVGTTTIIGPEKWDNLTVTETSGDAQSINLGQFKCRTDERPSLLTPPHRTRTTNRSPVFSWTPVTYASRYRIFLFDNKVAADRTVDIRQNTAGPETSMIINQPLPIKRLFWRMRGRTNRVWGLWSVRFALFIEAPAVAPTTPVPTIDLSGGDSADPSIPPTPIPSGSEAIPTFPPPPNSR